MKQSILRKILLNHIAVAALHFMPTTASAEINTATIMTSGASPSCADYQTVGVCYWLYCTYWSCSVKTSVKVHHFIPEMVVSVYNHNNQNPWKEVNFMNKGVMGGQYETPTKKYTQYTFKNGDAIGHPGGIILQMFSSYGYSCESQTTPFQPYFLSALDAIAWRSNMPEMFYPEAITPGMREVSKAGDLWGNIYPRSGSVTQTHDYKAAAVIAQRIADIVSRTGQLHVYYPATRSGGQGKWYPKEVKEGDKKTHRWQMLSPKMEQSCSVFPDGNATDSYGDKVSPTENYSWALWRPYACCKREGQVFLGNTDWITTHTH
ncbi:TIGR03756 family integrating conjugative element protein [Avibacterium sp. 21-599]|uniref:TIGR03756 family integrating conjugative element protein n=1 Tax=Avibacterium sp. 21-599 TaxID=2911528 RepID=UPI003FA34952